MHINDSTTRVVGHSPQLYLNLLLMGLWPPLVRELNCLDSASSPSVLQCIRQFGLSTPPRILGVAEICLNAAISLILYFSIRPQSVWHFFVFLSTTILFTLGVSTIASRLIYAWFTRKRAQLQIRKCLHTVGIFVCLRCGYRLISTLRCPECGLSLDVPENQ